MQPSLFYFSQIIFTYTNFIEVAYWNFFDVKFKFIKTINKYIQELNKVYISTYIYVFLRYSVLDKNHYVRLIRVIDDKNVKSVIIECQNTNYCSMSWCLRSWSTMQCLDVLYYVMINNVCLKIPTLIEHCFSYIVWIYSVIQKG